MCDAPSASSRYEQRGITARISSARTAAEHWDEQWKLFGPDVTPYEADRSQYRYSRYPKPTIIELSWSLFEYLVSTSDAAATLDGLLLLGLAPVVPEELTTMLEVSGLSGLAAAATTARPQAVEEAAAGSTSGGAVGAADLSASSMGCVSPISNSGGDATRPSSAGAGGSGGAAAVVAAPAGIPATTPPAAAAAGPIPAASRAVTAAAQHAVVGSGRPSVLARPHAIKLRVIATEPKQVSFDDSVDDSSPSGVDRMRDLEAEVRDLTRQLRLLKSREQVASQSESPMPSSVSPPIPAIVQTKPFIASTSGNTVVCLPVNYLDPDMAPYVVSIAGLADRQLVPCTILEHRYVIFVAPAHPPGSVSVTLLCTQANGTLRRYTRGVWLEYRVPEQLTTLSYHAVNMLGGQEIPLPSSTTGPDPSEYNTEGGKSEADMTEQAELDEGLISDTTSVATVEEHPKLTREMLEMLQGGRAVTIQQGNEGGSSPVLNRSQRRLRSIATSECGSEAVSSSYLLHASAAAPSLGGHVVEQSAASDTGLETRSGFNETRSVSALGD